MIIIGPLWILNSILFIAHFFTFVFFLFNRDTIEIKIQWQNKKHAEPELIKSQLLDFNFIHKKDIFSTTSPIIEEKKVYTYKPYPLVTIQYAPELPPEIQIKNTPIITKNVLPPLQIALHGTLITENPMNNKVFIENINSKNEREYGIGDTIEDAQIIFINKNKVIFVRSNGQEESIYLNKNFKIEEDASNNILWSDIVYYDDNEGMYYLNTDLFKTKISSFAELIYTIGLTTVLDKNQVIGCKIEKNPSGSLPAILHINNNDIITKINNLDITSADNRMTLINEIQHAAHSKDIFKIIIDLGINESSQRQIILNCYKNKKELKVRNVGLFKVYEEKSESK
jgi:type II secretion system protein C